MRILMLTDLYPPFVGGIEQHVRNLSRGLVARGHHVSVATMRSEGSDEEVDAGVRINRIRSVADLAGPLTNPGGRPFAPPFPDPVVTAGLRRIIKAERPEIVHAHNWMLNSFLPLKRWSHAKLVVTLHDYGVVCARRDYLYAGAVCSGPGLEKCLRCAAGHYGPARGPAITLGNWITQPVAARLVDLWLPVSTAVAEYSRLAESSRPYRVIPNFVSDDVASDADDGHPALAQLPTGPYVLYVGALSRHKGVDVILRAHQRMGASTPLVLIGAPIDLPPTLPPDVTVLPVLPHSAVMAAWKRSAVAVVPSRFPDPCPTVVMEAMATARPVVASRVGGIPDLVSEGQTGYLVDAGDHRGLAAALETLLADDALRERMGRAALQKVSAFMSSAVLVRLEDAYRDVVARAS